MKYKTTIIQTGNNTGIEVPENILTKLNGGLKPLVVVTLNGHSYRSAVGKMGGKYMISLSAENRKLAGVSGGDTLDVNVELDTAPRTVSMPDDFSEKLTAAQKEKFNKLAPSKQKAIITSIEEAKTVETRARRIEKALEGL